MQKSAERMEASRNPNMMQDLGRLKERDPEKIKIILRHLKRVVFEKPVFQNIVGRLAR